VGTAPHDSELDALGVRILDQLSTGIVVTRDGLVIYCNGAFESMTGLECRAVLGCAHPFLREGHVVDGDGDALRGQIERGAPGQTVRVRYERDDGFPTWNEIQIYHDGDHVIWMHRDVTQQLATHELWQRYAFLVDTSRQFMALVNRDFQYELVNPSFARWFGVEPDEINGSSGATIWGSAVFGAMVAPCLERCFKGEEVQLQRWVELPGGATRYLDMIYTPYRGKDSEVQHAVFVAWDNTDEKNATEAVSEMNRVLEHRVGERTAELQDTMRELEAFNYTIAHDLRSPLRFLKSFARMLEDEAGGCLSEAALHYCAMISQGVAEMQHLIDRLLDFSRLSRKPISPIRCDLNAIVASACETVLLDECTALSVADLPCCLGDAPLLKQVFVNLLGNAVKFTREASAPRIEVYSGTAPPGYVHICVRDNGIGFHMNHAEAMFAPFKQVHENAGVPGSGLGLAIVRRIVERHGGAVWADGEEGAGATIHVQLSACPEDTM